jgi:hypothetical protein
VETYNCFILKEYVFLMKFFQVLTTLTVDKGLWHIEELYLVTDYMHEEQFLLTATTPTVYFNSGY